MRRWWCGVLMRGRAIICGSWVGAALLTLTGCMSDTPWSARADQGSSRWGEAPPAQGDAGRYGEEGGEPPASGKPRFGARTLKVGQEVAAAGCEAYPLSCLCPPDSVKVMYYGSDGWMKKSSKKATCLASACKPGEMMRKRVNTSKGSVKFVCEKVAQ